MNERHENPMPNLERVSIRNAVKQARGSIALAARLLGISQSDLQKRLEQSGLTHESPEE
jgi:DNA-binding NtrC family response regulator